MLYLLTARRLRICLVSVKIRTWGRNSTSLKITYHPHERPCQMSEPQAVAKQLQQYLIQRLSYYREVESITERSLLAVCL